MAGPSQRAALLRGAVALLCASACAVAVLAAPCANRNIVDGVATDGTDANAEWVSDDGKLRITGCNNTVSGNTVSTEDGVVTINGRDNVVRRRRRAARPALAAA
jgi:hypothetical protein